MQLCKQICTCINYGMAIPGMFVTRTPHYMIIILTYVHVCFQGNVLICADFRRILYFSAVQKRDGMSTVSFKPTRLSGKPILRCYYINIKWHIISGIHIIGNTPLTFK